MGTFRVITRTSSKVHGRSLAAVLAAFLAGAAALRVPHRIFDRMTAIVADSDRDWTGTAATTAIVAAPAMAPVLTAALLRAARRR